MAGSEVLFVPCAGSTGMGAWESDTGGPNQLVLLLCCQFSSGQALLTVFDRGRKKIVRVATDRCTASHRG